MHCFISVLTSYDVSRKEKKELSVQERCEIIAFHKTKHSIRKIADLTGHTKSTVHYTISRFKKTNSCENVGRSGRPPAITERDKRYLKLCALRDRRKFLNILTEDFNGGRKTPVSQSVINRALHSWSLIGRVAARKPLISSRNVKKRLAFAKEHVKWGKEKGKEFFSPTNPNLNYLEPIEEPLLGVFRTNDLRNSDSQQP